MKRTRQWNEQSDESEQVGFLGLKKRKPGNEPKKYLLIFGMIFGISMFYYSVNGLFTIKKDEAMIQWQDEALGAAVRDNMMLSDDAGVPIYSAGKFYPGNAMLLEGRDIKYLDDLQYFSRVNNLVIRNTSVTDFSPLRKMSNLETLAIEGGIATNLEPIGQLKNLSTLELSDLPYATIPSLENLPNLSQLWLDGMQLENLATIGTLKGLSNFHIKNSNVKDVSALSQYKSLWTLTIDNCPIESLPELPETLAALELHKTSIKNLSVLPQTIRVIKLTNNAIDYQTLNGFKNLSVLNIQDTDLGNVDNAINLPNLEMLSLVNCSLERFDLVTGGRLRNVDLSKNKIKSIHDIENTKNITVLSLSDNKLTGLEGLEDITNLSSLILTGNQIANVDILEIKHKYPSLQVVFDNP